jgi:hypothetical protein
VSATPTSGTSSGYQTPPINRHVVAKTSAAAASALRPKVSHGPRNAPTTPTSTAAVTVSAMPPAGDAGSMVRRVRMLSITLAWTSRPFILPATGVVKTSYVADAVAPTTTMASRKRSGDSSGAASSSSCCSE